MSNDAFEKLLNECEREFFDQLPEIGGLPNATKVYENAFAMCYEKLMPLIEAYREKRAVDGLNGRTWDASKHLEAEEKIKELERNFL